MPCRSKAIKKPTDMYKEISWEDQTTVLKNAGESWKRKKNKKQSDSVSWKKIKHPTQKS